MAIIVGLGAILVIVVVFIIRRVLVGLKIVLRSSSR